MVGLIGMVSLEFQMLVTAFCARLLPLNIPLVYYPEASRCISISERVNIMATGSGEVHNPLGSRKLPRRLDCLPVLIARPALGNWSVASRQLRIALQAWEKGTGSLLRSPNNDKGGMS